MSTNSQNQLKGLRKEIDKADKNLLIALAKRFGATKKIGEYKAKNDLPVRDKKREKEMMAMRKKWAKKLSLKDPFISQVFSLILKNVYKDHRKLRKNKGRTL